MNILIVAFFAFFHGYVHGQEISASASLMSYTLGFVFATLLLHGAGIATSRLMAIAFAFFIGSSVNAQETESTVTEPAETTVETKSKSSNKDSVEFEEMTIVERADSQVGIADSASQGNVGQAQRSWTDSVAHRRYRLLLKNWGSAIQL
jgi:HupE / UreJ protein